MLPRNITQILRSACLNTSFYHSHKFPIQCSHQQRSHGSTHLSEVSSLPELITCPQATSSQVTGCGKKHFIFTVASRSCPGEEPKGRKKKQQQQQLQQQQQHQQQQDMQTLWRGVCKLHLPIKLHYREGK